MMTSAIQLSGLHKQFGRGRRRVKAVNGLDLTDGALEEHPLA